MVNLTSHGMKEFVLRHSRSYAETHGIPVSRLCWTDKWSPMFDPTHFYWLRGNASGEIHEYRKTFPRAEGESSLMWTVAFKAYVRENSHKIWAGSKGNPNHGYEIQNLLPGINGKK